MGVQVQNTYCIVHDSFIGFPFAASVERQTHKEKTPQSHNLAALAFPPSWNLSHVGALITVVYPEGINKNMDVTTYLLSLPAKENTDVLGSLLGSKRKYAVVIFNNYVLINLCVTFSPHRL